MTKYGKQNLTCFYLMTAKFFRTTRIFSINLLSKPYNLVTHYDYSAGSLDYLISNLNFYFAQTLPRAIPENSKN